MTALLFTIGLGGLRSGAASADPDLSNVTDILGGQRHILRADDLVFGAPPFRLGINDFPNPNTLQAITLQTQGLKIAKLVASPVVGTPCQGSAPHPLPFQSRVGRLFPLKNDVLVNLAPLDTAGPGCAGNPNLGIYIQDPQDAANNSLTRITASPNFAQVALGDFDRDGLDDVVLINDEAIALYRNASADAPTRGVVEASRLAFGSQSQMAPLSEPVVGDFNGDGAIDIAWAGQSGTGSDRRWHIYFASVCPAARVVVLGQVCSKPLQVILSPHTIAAGLLRNPDGSTTNFVVLTAGDYDGIPSKITGLPVQKLVVLQQTSEVGRGAEALHNLSVYSFDETLVPTERATLNGFAGFGGVTVDQPFITSARLRSAGQTDQVVFTSVSLGQIWVVEFAQDLKMNVGAGIELNGLFTPCVRYLGLAAGRFDPPNTSTGTNFNPQVALLAQEVSGGDCGTPNLVNVAIFSNDPTLDFTLQLASNTTVFHDIVLFNEGPSSNLLRAGDTQGRSLRLGTPTKVTIESHAQPSVILAAPPMHVDFITPDGTSAPLLLNLSAVPAGYFTQYQAEETSKDQSSDQQTTSWSRGAQEKVGEKLTLGNPKSGAFFSQTLDIAAQQTWAGSTDSIDTSYSARSFNVSQQTGFGDQVWFTESRFNLYIYPVIGHQACPDDGSPGSDCPDSKKTPLFIQVSGADQIQNETVSGASLEWYQPPWEPGNVFSYPGSEAQLKTIHPDMAILSGAPLTWFTDSSVFTEKTSWASGSGKSQSASSKQTFSEDVSLSIAGQYSVQGVASIGGSFSVSGSFSNSTAALNTHQTSIGKSSGIGVQKPGSFATPQLYQYAVTPYIFGQTPPKGNVNAQPALPTDVKTFGTLRTAFLADPTSPQAGSWWSQAYGRAPDVAVNHPSRWQISTQNRTNPTRPNCLSVNAQSPTVQCATLAAARPDNPWLSPFHYLRGFFITNDGASGKGPQLQMATAGDKLVLQTRVYNYSLAPMRADTVVHVRFYGQPWDHTTNTPRGKSFLIGEDALGQIPPFDPKGPLNWVLAQTKFDTKPYGNQYLTFWVVVWMQHPGGLSEELPGHGLNAVPGDLGSLADAHALSETYSNNVGFYKSAFYVKGASTTGLLAAALPQSQRVRLGAVHVSPHHADAGEHVVVRTTLTAKGDAVPGATVWFYDGDPHHGGTLFDAERVAHIRANDRHEVAVLFSSDTCGHHRSAQHRIFAVTGKGTPSEHIRRSDRFTVNCRDRGRPFLKPPLRETPYQADSHHAPEDEPRS